MSHSNQSHSPQNSPAKPKPQAEPLIEPVRPTTAKPEPPATFQMPHCPEGLSDNQKEQFKLFV